MLILTSTSAQDTSKTDTADREFQFLQIQVYFRANCIEQHCNHFCLETEKREGFSAKSEVGQKHAPCEGSPHIPKNIANKKAVHGHYGDAYGDTSWSCCSGLCWFMFVTKRISSIMNMSLHTKKILPLQSPLLLSRCMFMNNGQCVLLFPDDILPKEISAETAFMSRIFVTVLNRFFLIPLFFFPK